MFQTGIPETFSFRRFIIAAPVLIIIVALVLVVIELIAAAILRPDPSFLPLYPQSVAITTFINLVFAAIVYAIIGAIGKRPWTVWYVISILGFLLGLIPDFQLLISGPNEMFPVFTSAEIIVLIIFHVVGAAIFIPLLPRWSAKIS